MACLIDCYGIQDWYQNTFLNKEKKYIFEPGRRSGFSKEYLRKQVKLAFLNEIEL